MNTMHLSGKLFQLYAAAAAIQLGGMQSGWSIVGDRDTHCSFDINLFGRQIISEKNLFRRKRSSSHETGRMRKGRERSKKGRASP